jgi:hypothetical protein
MQKRYEGALRRIEGIGSLRQTLSLPAGRDISERQWDVIEAKIRAVRERLEARLKNDYRSMMATSSPTAALRPLNYLLGECELELTKAYAFFDTYLDVLSQRHIPSLGQLLAGCDALAWDSIHRYHPALAIVEPPLVYCDRGFGASTIREGVVMPGQSPNPLPLIQIPYSRLIEKYNLTSVLHEVGHEAMVRLGLVKRLPIVIRSALSKAGAPADLQNFFGLWMSEIAPDFWAFCGAGVAAAGGIREVLALPSTYVFRLSWTDPHPPAYLRVLLNFQWCRTVWGNGWWDEWEREWKAVYPLTDAPVAQRQVLREAERYLPLVSNVLLNTRFRVLEGKTLPSLFDLPTLHPAALKPIARQAAQGKLDLKNLRPCAHLAVFRIVKQMGYLDEPALDRVMSDWLNRLNRPL